MSSSASRSLVWLTAAALLLALGGCAFPAVRIHANPDALTLIQGQRGTTTLETGPPVCVADTPLPCPDVTGRVFDYVVQNVPDGVSYSFDTSLRSPGTPGLVRITFVAAQDAVPSAYELAIHVVLDGRSLDVFPFKLRILPASVRPTAAPVAIAAGSRYSIAALADGTVRAWGENNFGQLGLGHLTRATVPTAVRDLGGVVAVAAGTAHALALTGDGRVWGWGINATGQLGRPPVRDIETVTRPILISGVDNIQAIAAGAYHSLALDGDGVVWTWGNYGYDDSIRDTPPIAVPNLPPIRGIAADARESFAVDVNGSVWRWGFFRTTSIHPGQMAGLAEVQTLVTGGGAHLALDSSGNVWSWGSNYNGLLGDGTHTDRPQVQRIAGLSNVVLVSIGAGSATAVTQDGTVWQWGRDLLPTAVALTGVGAIAAGGGHVLALLDCGGLWSWGSNDDGQLGDGTTERQDFPRPVPGVGDDSHCARVSLRVTLTGDVASGANPIQVQPGTLERNSAEYFGTFDRGSIVQLTAAADVFATGILGSQQSRFDGWTFDCAGMDASATLTLDRSKRCAAVYREVPNPRSLLTIESDGGMVTSSGGGVGGPYSIACPVQCNAVFPRDTVVTVRGVDANGFAFTHWTGDCSGTARETTVTMDGAKTCRAHFRPFELAVVVAGSGSVSIEGTGFECHAACAFEPRQGNAVLRATPAFGWRFDAWGGDCAGTSVLHTIAMNADRACIAQFSRTPGFFFLTMVVEGAGSVTSQPAGIDCPSTCVALYPAGSAIDLTALQTSSSMVSFWFDDCAAPGLLTNRIVMDSDKRCRIRFVGRPAFPIAVMSWPPGPRVGQIITFDGTASYLFDPVTGTQNPAGIRGWTWDFENDGSVEATAPIAQHAFQSGGNHDVRLRVEGGPFFETDDDIEPVFVRDPTGTLFGLTVNKAGTGRGDIVTEPPGLVRCSAPCTSVGPLLLESTSVVTLRATADLGSSFVGWSGSGCASAAATTVVTMSAARTCTATFTLNQFTLTVNNGGNGVVTSVPAGIACGFDCAETLDGGVFVTLTAVPDPGFQVGAWTGCDAETTTQCSVVMDANRTIDVTFVPVSTDFTLTVVINAQPGSVASVIAVAPPGNAINCRAGTGGPVCSQTFAPGTVVQVRPSDSVLENGRFGGWSGCNAVGVLAICTVNLTSNRAVTITILP